MNPFTSDTSLSVAALGESQLIGRLRDWLGTSNPAAPEGIGDDCAVFQASAPHAQQLITTDPVIYGKHFDDELEPEQVAAKLAKRNLSDIAAMGGQPRLATVGLALDGAVSIEWIKRFYEELARQADRWGFSVVGGDVSHADRFLGAFFTLLGDMPPGSSPLLRHRAAVGSPIFATGALGGSRRAKHHTFTPRIEEGQWLARSGACLACTDLSDGLGKDLSNLLSSAIGCQVDCRAVPIAEDARICAGASGRSPLHHAFNDGEDYELLFALKPQTDLSAFVASWRRAFDTPLTRIGTAIAGSGPRIQLLNASEAILPTGYEHMR